jgi:hypothetical protein
MHRIATLLFVLVAIAASATPVAAAKPSRDPIVIPPEFLIFGAGQACAFPIHIEILVNREYIKTWTDADGNPIRDQINGSLWIRIFNDLTDASVDLNVGGPGRDLYNPDGSLTQVFLGHGLPIFEGIFYGTIGYYAFDLNADFSLDEVGAAHGRTLDVCAMIA